MMSIKVDLIGVPSHRGANLVGSNMGPVALRNLGLYDTLYSTTKNVRELGDVRVLYRHQIEPSYNLPQFPSLPSPPSWQNPDDAPSGLPTTSSSSSPTPDGSPQTPQISSPLRTSDSYLQATFNSPGSSALPPPPPLFHHELSQLCAHSLKEERLPLVIGGDHSISSAVAEGLIRAQGLSTPPSKWGILWIDAHLDAHTNASSPSGCHHGMVLERIISQHHPSKKHPSHHGSLDPANVVVLGARSIDYGERENLSALGAVRIYSMSHIRQMSLTKILDDLSQQWLSYIDALYVSWNLDSLDPSIAPGVSTPIAGGLSTAQALELGEWIHQTSMLRALDIVEWNPLYDEQFKTGKLAIELISACLGARQP